MLTKQITLRPSGDVAVATTEYSVHDSAIVASAATATTSNKLVDSTQSFSSLGVAVGDIVKNTTTGTFAVVTAIDSATTLSISADIMSDEDEYEIYSGKGYKLQENFETLVVILDVTAAATAAGDTLDVYVDTSFEGGAYGTWINIGHFTQVLGNGGAKRFVMSFKANPVAASNSVSATADQAAAAALQIGFGDRLRVRAVTVDGDNVDFTYSVKAFLKK